MLGRRVTPSAAGLAAAVVCRVLLCHEWINTAGVTFGPLRAVSRPPPGTDGAGAQEAGRRHRDVRRVRRPGPFPAGRCEGSPPSRPSRGRPGQRGPSAAGPAHTCPLTPAPAPALARPCPAGRPRPGAGGARPPGRCCPGCRLRLFSLSAPFHSGTAGSRGKAVRTPWLVC